MLSGSDNPNRRNILIVGGVGVGKSSLINLISGENLAVTSSRAKSCTLHSEEHIVHLDDVEFALHDTAGVHEAHGNMKKSEYLEAILQAYSLISRLERTGGISLLIFCMKGGRISVTTQQTYSLFVNVLCSRQVPIVIAVTHLESYTGMEQWWTDNEKDIHEYGLRSDGHACIMATRGYENVYAEQYEESRKIVRRLLLDFSSRVAPGRKEDSASWVKRMLHNRQKQLYVSDLTRKLVQKCGFSYDDAEAVAHKIQQTRAMWADVPEENNIWYDNPNRRNVLIVGDAGVGKSSLINLISGENLAVKSCTFHSEEHIVHLDDVEFALHNTAGVHEAHGNMKKSEYLEAILQAYSLISRLERTSGISLLVFCMKGGRTSITTQQTYSLFVDVLCSRQVPIAIVVTHLELYAECMEQWWTDNEKGIQECGLRSDGHACITATRGYKDGYAQQYEESREAVWKLLLEFNAREEDKVKRMLLVRNKQNQLYVGNFKKKLIKQCGFSNDDAEAIAHRIQQRREMWAGVPEENSVRY